MGRGDRRSRKGKLWRGTYGKRRPKKQRNHDRNSRST
ncbi:MAG: 30S ribosomal protein THX [Spirochaetota bacterium]